MLLYLALNCFNRPFDDQSQDRIAQETTAVFAILQRIIDGVAQLVWSAILTFENAQHPLADRRTEIAQRAHRTVVNVAVSQQVATRARALTASWFLCGRSFKTARFYHVDYRKLDRRSHRSYLPRRKAHAAPARG